MVIASGQHVQAEKEQSVSAEKKKESCTGERTRRRWAWRTVVHLLRTKKKARIKQNSPDRIPRRQGGETGFKKRALARIFIAPLKTCARRTMGP